MKPPTFKDPAELLRASIATSIEPLKTELAAAVATDKKLYAEMQDVLPERVKAEWERLFIRACSGDSEAVAEIQAEGGEEAWKNKRWALQPVREAYRVAAAKGCVPLLERLRASLFENLERTRTAIEEQWRALQAYHGEPLTLSIWDERIRNLKNGLQNMPAAADNGAGIAWQLTQLGLNEFLIE